MYESPTGKITQLYTVAEATIQDFVEQIAGVLARSALGRSVDEQVKADGRSSIKNHLGPDHGWLCGATSTDGDRHTTTRSGFSDYEVDVWQPGDYDPQSWGPSAVFNAAARTQSELKRGLS